MNRILNTFLFHSIAFIILSLRRLLFRLVTLLKHFLDDSRWAIPLQMCIFFDKSPQKDPCPAFVSRRLPTTNKRNILYPGMVEGTAEFTVIGKTSGTENCDRFFIFIPNINIWTENRRISYLAT